MLNVPKITKETHDGIAVIDVDSLELDERIITISGEVTMESAVNFRMAFSYLEKRSSDPVTVFISSPGGSVNAGLMIYDLIVGSRVPVATVCLGEAASIAAVILAAGHKGMRCILPHSTVMIHEPLIPEGVGGSASEFNRVAEKLNKTRLLMAKLLAERTGKTEEEMLEAISYDHFMNAEESLAFGMIDRVINNPAEVLTETV